MQVDGVTFSAVVGGLVLLLFCRDHVLELCRSRVRRLTAQAAPPPETAAEPPAEAAPFSVPRPRKGDAVQPISAVTRHNEQQTPASPAEPPAEQVGVHAPEEAERHVRARLKYTVDGNVRWLRDSVESGCAADACAAVRELDAVFEHLKTLGLRGRHRTVEYCNALVDADGVDLLHTLTKTPAPAGPEQLALRDSATVLFRQVVPLIYS